MADSSYGLNACLTCWLALAAGALAAGRVGQPDSPGEPLARQALPKDVMVAVDGNTTFALDLHAKLRAEEKGNLFCLPHSISTVLAMTYAGARATAASCSWGG